MPTTTPACWTSPAGVDQLDADPPHPRRGKPPDDAVQPMGIAGSRQHDIVVEQADDRPPSRFRRLIVQRRIIERTIVAQDPHPVQAFDLPEKLDGLRLGAGVIDDDHLEGGIGGARQQRFEAGSKQIDLVAGRNDDRNQRQRIGRQEIESPGRRQDRMRPRLATQA